MAFLNGGGPLSTPSYGLLCTFLPRGPHVARLSEPQSPHL